MSYCRGKYYIWSDGNHIHLPLLYKDTEDCPIPNKVLDEYVVMRFAEMTKSTITRAEKRALKNHLGNFGCDGLAKKHGKKTALEIIKEKIDKNHKINKERRN